MKEINLKETRKLFTSGSSTAVTLPVKFLEELNLKTGDEIELGLFTGRLGKYAAFWSNKTIKKSEAKK